MEAQNLQELSHSPTFRRLSEGTGRPAKMCPLCGNSIQFVFIDNATYLAATGENPHWTELPCRVCEDAQDRAKREEQRIERCLKNSALGKRFSEKTLDTFKPYGAAKEKDKQTRILKAIQEYTSAFAGHRKTGTWLLFMGTVGTGKGHLCAGILNCIIRAGFTGLFVKMPIMLREIKDTFSNKNTEESHSQIITHMVSCDLLVIDEVGVQFGTDTERMIIYDILDQRYEAMLPVILTTNIMDIKSLETCLGDKIIDRLYEGESKIFRFDWHSYRKFQRNEQ
jgi:DNA replication protein DnaC